MTIVGVITLILLGILIILAEIFLVPGSTVVGIMGLLLQIAGIISGYLYLPTFQAHIIFLGTLGVTGALTYWGFKTNTWKKFEIKETISEKSPKEKVDSLSVGQVGKTISKLTPVGKAIFENEIVEVYSSGDYIEKDVEIVITQISNTKIIVKKVS